MARKSISEVRNRLDVKSALSSLSTSVSTIQSDISDLAPQTSFIYQSATSKKTVTATNNIPALTNVKICNANPNRKGFSVYNNSTNSLYIGVEIDVSGGNQIAQLGSNATVDAYKDWWGPCIWTGALYGRRNAGTGGVTVWEFE